MQDHAEIPRAEPLSDCSCVAEQRAAELSTETPRSTLGMRVAEEGKLLALQLASHTQAGVVSAAALKTKRRHKTFDQVLSSLLVPLADGQKDFSGDIIQHCLHASFAATPMRCRNSQRPCHHAEGGKRSKAETTPGSKHESTIACCLAPERSTANPPA
uniref:Uncharacterized protein n=1 Tax=Alexandrium monilatum TaxID=311494 RepID=A0A7S4Q6Y4_9DINO